MYSSSTILVFTMGNGVNGFTLDPQIGEFVMTHPDIQVPKRGKVRETPSAPIALATPGGVGGGVLEVVVVLMDSVFFS